MGKIQNKPTQLESLRISLKETGTLGGRPELICWVFKFCLVWFALVFVRQDTEVSMRLSEFPGLITLIYRIHAR